VTFFLLQEPDFTEDRIVVREEDDQPKKQGWFSRKKKPAPKPQNVSRPPPGATFAPQSPRSSTGSAAEEDLPPRTEKPSAPPSPSKEDAPGRSSDPPEAGESNPDLPARAGFDLDAIKAAIGNPELNPEELEVPGSPPSRPGAPRTARSVSTPGLGLGVPSSSLVPPRPSDGTDHAVADLGSRPSHPRAVSMNAMHRDDDDDTVYAHPSMTAPRSSAPSLAFGGSDGALWSRDAAVEDDDTSNRPKLDFEPDTQSSHSITSEPTTFGSRYIPPPPHNPFAAFASGPSLSFGGSDGTITTNFSSVVEKDAWSVRSGVDTKKVNGLNSNPWAS
jgi:hypothetical protein